MCKLLELFVPPFLHLLNRDAPGASLDGYGSKAWEESGTVPGMQQVLTKCQYDSSPISFFSDLCWWPLLSLNSQSA